MVGSWVISKEAGKNVLFIDGRVWKRGQPAGGLADKARELYGARNEEFIESVKAFAYYPIAVYKGVDNFENGDISVRFQMVGGTLDRCAGILFNVKPNGDYLDRALQRHGGQRRAVDVQQGRSQVREARARARAARAGHVAHAQDQRPRYAASGLSRRQVRCIDYTLTEPVSGKIGVWSKTDSMIEFDDFTVTPAAK